MFLIIQINKLSSINMAVLWAVENKITGGTSADKFGVGKPCTRGQIVTFLYKVYNK